MPESRDDGKIKRRSTSKSVDAPKILIADDYALVRAALSELLRLDGEMTVVGETGKGRDMVEQVEKLRPDVLLLSMNARSDFDLLRRLSTARTKAHTILVVESIERRQVIEALRLGVRGVLLEDTKSSLLYKCIRTVMAGEYWIDRDSVSDLVHALSNAGTQSPESEQANGFGLTHRELEVLLTVVEGCTNKEIASKFKISEQTVKHHLTRIYEKTGVTNRLELALFAINKGLSYEV